MIIDDLRDRLLGAVADRLIGLGESRTTRVVIDRDLKVPMPDGATLVTDHYRPVEVSRGPVVLIRTPYDKSNLLGRAYGLALARRGLQAVVQDVRGTFGSDGEFEPFHHETDDGLATLAWIREQDWCDGRVGTAGLSYVGYTQWAIGPYAEPRLSAMALGITAADFRPTFYPGRSVGWQLLLDWSSGIGIQDSGTRLEKLGLKRRVAAAMTTLPASRGTRASIGQDIGFLHEILDHAEPDDQFWDFLDHGRDLAALDTPVSMLAGWYDIFLTEQLRDFTELQRAGAEVRLTVGPWWHGDRPSVGPIFRDQVDWLAGQLLGDRAILARRPVRIYLQQAGRWLDFDSWPVPAEPRDYHLDADGSLITEIPATEAIRAFNYDPADPTPVDGGAPLGIPGGQVDNRTVERRDDVLTYQTATLADDLDVIGDASATIFVRTEHSDADVFVRVCDVGPNGRSLNVIEGIRRLRAADEPIDDIGTRKVEIELWPTAYRFRAGHRIRVQVSGGGFPNYIRNHQTGESISDAVRTAAGRTQILHGPEHLSRIVLPIFR
ncbi:peptidase S15 [Microlunatus endophyticus]|uniref:Peptidase S15 n=1 Tax=Microlunatus endophyticus TaxID=1716077 RepID=A0A917SA92_9ACTN|nr:CocE/NonD family hydrolase [Microlunatus endophyticus]GGL63285.1 peptidase S15 [Microlunatus endophyticus]